MSTLVIQLPPRDRIGPRADDSGAGNQVPLELVYVSSRDGRTVEATGVAAPAALPRARTVVLALAEADVAWHRIDVPRAPPARLRAALAGAMEELLLDDDDAVHLALGAGAVAGQAGWVAVAHKPWLAAALTALEAAGVQVERVVPACAPAAPVAGAGAGGAGSSGTGVQAPHWRGHFFIADPTVGETVWLALSGPEGAACVALGGLARAMLPPEGTPVDWSATPAAAQAAERWLGAPVPVMSEAERSLEAARGTANLRQFDLALRRRGALALRDALRGLQSPAWRAVRFGLVSLLLVHLAGLNAWAWQQRDALDERKRAMSELLRTTYPGVRAVLDAPLQMLRETERLRVAAGKPGEADVEFLLAAAAAAWPDAQGPVQSLQFEPGRLVLAVPGWGEPQLAQFRARLQPAGFGAEFQQGRIEVARLPNRGAAR